jgi:hypothetical protein
VQARYRLLDVKTKEAEDGLLVFLDEAEVQVSIVKDADERWIVEMADGARCRAANGEMISVGDQSWKLLVPLDSPFIGTCKANPPLTMATIALRFHVSDDEKHISLDIVNGDEVIALRESVLFETLLLLARKRIDDAYDSKLSEKEQGWYDAPDLYHELGVDELSLNRTICRLRKLFIKTRVEGGRGIVERRTKKLRIGTARLQIA